MITRAGALEDELVALVAALPALPIDRLRALADDARALATGARPPTATLARALGAVLDRYADGAAPLEGWGLVAQAASTLAGALAAPGAAAATALAAATHEVDALAAPAPTSPRPARTPDVPLTSLRRRT